MAVTLYQHKDTQFLLEVEVEPLALILLETMEEAVNFHLLMLLAAELEAVKIQMRVDQEDLEAEADREVQRALEMLEVTHHQKVNLEAADLETKAEEEAELTKLGVMLFMDLEEMEDL